MNYRTLDIIDFESYDKIRTLALDTYPEAFLSSNTSERADRKNKYISTIENDFNFIMGAFDIDNLVGIVTFIRENREKSKHKGGIFAMFLKTEYQGKGIATKLLELTLDKAFQIKGLKQINLGVN